MGTRSSTSQGGVVHERRVEASPINGPEQLQSLMLSFSSSTLGIYCNDQ
jgi:hypothetical protein